MQKENSEIKQPKKRISPIVVPTIEEETSKEDSTKNSQNKKIFILTFKIFCFIIIF